jgi:hypothetical protein
MSNSIQGLALIGGEAVRGKGAAFQAFDPSRNEALGPDFNAVDADQINEACALAGTAFDTFRATTMSAPTSSTRSPPRSWPSATISSCAPWPRPACPACAWKASAAAR